jgi:hypothetical protein
VGLAPDNAASVAAPSAAGADAKGKRRCNQSPAQRFSLGNIREDPVVIRSLFSIAALLSVALLAGCGCGGTSSAQCILPPDIGKTGSAPHAETGIGRDARNYRPLGG